MNQTKKEAILITGANGQIGKALQLYFTAIAQPFYAFEKATLDISSESQLNKVFHSYDFNVIVNCAAFTDTEIAELQPLKAYHTNVKGAQLLAEFCEKFNKTLISLSTNCIFDGLKTTPYIETDNAQPISVYGRTKLEGENTIQSHCKKHVIIRTSWIFSEFEGHNFVLKILKKGAENKQLKIVNDQFGCPTSAHALAQVIYQFCMHAPDSMDWCGVFNYCSKEPTSWFGFSEEIFALAKQENLVDVEITAVHTGEVPTNLQRPKNGILDCTKVSALGISLPDWKADLSQIIKLIANSKVKKAISNAV